MGIEGHQSRVMGWLRAHRRTGAAVALLAMVLQFTALFGHVHPRDVFGAPLAFKSQTLDAGDIANAAVDHGTLPHDGDAVCAVCAVGQLAATALTASAPALFVPVAHQQRAPPPPIAVAEFEQNLSFWSRGPPAV